MKSGIEVKTVGEAKPATPEVPVLTPVVTPDEPDKQLMSGVKFLQSENQDEIGQLQASADAETHIDTQNELTNTSEASEDTSETESKDGVTRHVVTYVGSGHWIDSDGKVWARVSAKGTDIKNVREYDDEDLQSRDDLKFMIGYGAMTVTTVTL